MNLADCNQEIFEVLQLTTFGFSVLEFAIRRRMFLIINQINLLNDNRF